LTAGRQEADEGARRLTAKVHRLGRRLWVGLHDPDPGHDLALASAPGGDPTWHYSGFRARWRPRSSGGAK